jgi:hypothetical protein
VSKGFSLADLIPEPLTFTDDGAGGDGRTYDVRPEDVFSAVEVFRFRRLSAQNDENDAAASEVCAGEIMHMLIPALPAERIAAIPMLYKLRFVVWWRQQGLGEPAGEAKPGQS